MHWLLLPTSRHTHHLPATLTQEGMCTVKGLRWRNTLVSLAV